MDFVVGFDLTSHGDDALRTALGLGSSTESRSIGVVHVVTQQALDKTGGLSAEEKQSAAIESLYPAIWKRVDAIRETFEGIEDGSEFDIDVIVRVAPVHLARAERHIALELLRVAVDFGATCIVLGKKGRPDSVAEHVAQHGITAPASTEWVNAPVSVLCVRVVPANLDVRTAD